MCIPFLVDIVCRIEVTMDVQTTVDPGSPGKPIVSSNTVAGSVHTSAHQQSALETEMMEELGYLPHWSSSRMLLARIFHTTCCEALIGAVVVFNMILIVVETDYRTTHEGESTWLSLSNTCLLIFYTLELGLRMYTYREMFFHFPMHIMDFSIVLADYCLLLLGVFIDDLASVAFLRVFRLVRLARSTRIMKFSPELSLLLRGLKDTTKTLFWGGIMIFLMLTIWSILAVEFIHPINLEVAEHTSDYDGCVRCARAYETVMQSSLTLFQGLIAGDSWGMVTIPVIEYRPWTAVYFVSVHISVSIGLMNLLLAVIVDRANAARGEDLAALVRAEEREQKKTKAKLLSICETMDHDKSGDLSLEELQDGFMNNHEFHITMKAMDISEDDIDVVFAIMDEDGSGSVKFTEFVDQIWKMKSVDDHTLLIFIKYSIAEVRRMTLRRLKEIEEQLSSTFRNQVGTLMSSYKDLQAELRQGTTKAYGGADFMKPLAPEKLQEQPSVTKEIVALRLVTEEMASMMKQNLEVPTREMSRRTGADSFSGETKRVDVIPAQRYPGWSLPGHGSTCCGFQKASPFTLPAPTGSPQAFTFDGQVPGKPVAR